MTNPADQSAGTCVCEHPKSQHAISGGVLACTVKGCACGPGCIHEGFVDRDSGTGALIEYEALTEARKRGEANMYVPRGEVRRLDQSAGTPTPEGTPRHERIEQALRAVLAAHDANVTRWSRNPERLCGCWFPADLVREALEGE
jgi:hypothetical protein